MPRRLRQERDEPWQTKERLRTERSMTYAECDVACQERDIAQQWVGSLETKLEREKARKLVAENASTGLGRTWAGRRRRC
jgi:hypothetical protein